MQYTERKKNNSFSFAALMLAFIFTVILGFVPMVSDMFATMLKPTFLVLCVLSPGYGFYRMKYEKWLIVLLIYLFLIYLVHMNSDPDISTYASMVLFGVFFLFAGLRAWTTREIKLFIHAIALACTFYSIVVLVYNSGLINIGDQHISFFGKTLNRNTCAFSVVPGAICASFLFLFSPKKGFRKPLYLFAMAVCCYTVIGLSCRSAFLSAISGIFLLVWEHSGRSHNKQSRWLNRMVFIVVTVIALYVLMAVLSGTNSERLFDYESTGRDDLWDAAVELIKAKPVFGGGFSYWSNSGKLMAPHNMFLFYMLIGGAVAGIILAFWMVNMVWECISTRNTIALAFSTEMIFHSISEGGLDYYAFIPLILTSILLHYSDCHRRSCAEILTAK